MAANYWVSSQRSQWLFTKESLAETRQKLEEADKLFSQQCPLPDLRLLSIYFSQQLTKLGKRMSTRQQALATAQIYIRRFYTKVDVRRTNPYLVLTTAFYLACKMEECPQHIRFVVTESRSIWPEFIAPDVAKLGECEFSLISEMHSQLTVHHPYRTLTELSPTLSLTPDEVALAWSIINDHYLTDLPLLQPPYVIAVMAILMAVVFKPSHANLHSGHAPSPLAGAIRDGGANALASLGDKNGGPPQRIQKIIMWLAESEVDIEAVIDCTQVLVSLYEIWEQYSEKTCKEQIGRYVKSRSLEK
ncbi:RNA polymerase II holoenzyme cyclin-like subunit [Arachnomyces sp. PD_36]|nr:RNA polymerase II holoenzyme cyclin-like subunit [Arachnomyces sp. PD_36]